MDQGPLQEMAELPSGIRLPYVEQGDVGGRPLVLLHGFGDSWRSFQRVLPHVPSDVRVLAVTQRGHGDASRPRTGYGVEDLAADLAAFMDVVGLRRAVVGGHSMGSAVARRFAIDRPDRTLGLVLAGASITAGGNPEARAYWDARLAELSDAVDPGFLRRSIEEAVEGPLEPSFLRVLMGEAAKVPAFVWRAAFEARRHAREDRDQLHHVSAPTLVCWGAHDRRYPRSEQEALRAAITGARLIVYPDAGHALHWDEPERFAKDIADFTRGLDGPHGSPA